MAELLSILYLGAFFASGLAVARYTFPDERPIRRVWLGAVFGFVMLIWLPALVSFLLSFALASQIIALALAFVIGTLFFLLSRKKERVHTPFRSELPILCVLIPILLFCLYLLSTHTIQPRPDGSLWVGQSTYGDLAMHLGFISSIATQGTFPPMYSICPDTLVGYPFLSESVGATFLLIGAELRFATMLTAAYAFVLVVFGVYFFFEEWLTTRRSAVFATLLFLIGGGFGFWYFFDLTKANPDNFTRAFTAFYETPTNFVENGLRWVNPIADMLIPQRALLFGWAVLFPCLFLLNRAAMKKDTRAFLPLGILAGSLPLIHTHSFLALGIISGFLFLCSLLQNEGIRQWKGYLLYLGIVLLAALPQLLIFTFPQSTGSGAIQFHFNWANESDRYIWFYVKNFGLIALMALPAFFDSEKQDRVFYASVIPIVVIAELIQFQPNTYDNNKLLFIAFAFTCGLIAKWLIGVWDAVREKKLFSRFTAGFLAVVTLFTLFASGTMTLAREAVSEYQLITADEVDAAEYIKRNAAKDATFLTRNNHNNLVAALTGRNIVCGSGSYLFYHGINTSEREAAVRAMYEQPELYFASLSERYNVDYVLIGAYERYDYAVNERYFAERYPIFFTNDTLTVYAVTPDP